MEDGCGGGDIFDSDVMLVFDSVGAYIYKESLILFASINLFVVVD